MRPGLGQEKSHAGATAKSQAKVDPQGVRSLFAPPGGRAYRFVPISLAHETGTPVEDSWAEMARLIEEGKVRFGGVSNFNVSLLEGCESIRHVDSLQPPFSLIRRDVAANEIPWCAEHKTGVICYSPMQSGLLTDGFSAERVARMVADDWRRRSPEFNPPNLERNLALRDALRPIAQRHGHRFRRWLLRGR